MANLEEKSTLQIMSQFKMKCLTVFEGGCEGLNSCIMEVAWDFQILCIHPCSINWSCINFYEVEYKEA